MKKRGQLVQEVDISKGVIKHGFRIEGGKLVKYTDYGRKRKNWMTNYRNSSRKYLKDKCENRRCNIIHYLTIHHKIPLGSAKSEEELIELCEKENCKTLCRKCHDELEYRLTLKRNGKAKKKKKVKKVRKVKLVKKVKLKKLSSESLLVLEETEWGGYRIIDSWN